ncbi:hypothetical protein [Streptomyces sp. NBC_00503]|nr:hypothetical protein [Streptomyces sp. NBC_00503]WUD79768.1 hypothetical protein OG490_03805 [Streptomyces sp. NBC_00503]
MSDRMHAFGSRGDLLGSDPGQDSAYPKLDVVVVIAHGAEP